MATLRELLNAIVEYQHPLEHRVLRGYRAIITGLFLLGEQLDFTISEITVRLNQLGWNISDATTSPRLAELKAIGILNDDLPKRPCRITRARKKRWRLSEGIRELLEVTYTNDTQ